MLYVSTPMQNLSDLLNASQFEGLAINKTPDGYAVSFMTGIGEWSAWVIRPTVVEALIAALAPPLPPCPVALPA